MFPQPATDPMSSFVVSLLIGCFVPIWQRFISLYHWRLGKMLFAPASSDTPRGSFSTVADRFVSRLAGAPSHCRSRAPRVRFPGTATPRHLKIHPHETPRLQGLGPPFRTRPSPFLVFPQRIPHPTTPSRPAKKDLLAEIDRFFQAGACPV